MTLHSHCRGGSPILPRSTSFYFVIINIVNNQQKVIAKNSSLKQRSFFWQISTILVTQGIFSATLKLGIIAVLALIYKSHLQTLFDSFPFIKIIISVSVIIFGLFFAISFVIKTSVIDEKKSKKICAWLAVFYLTGFTVPLVLSGKQILTNYYFLNIILQIVTVYFCSRYIFNRAEKIRQSCFRKISVRAAEYLMISAQFVMITTIVSALLIAVFTNNKNIMEFLPETERARFEFISEQYQRAQIEFYDNLKLIRGQQLFTQLKLMKSNLGLKYPMDLKNDRNFQMSEQFGQELLDTAGGNKEYQVTLDAFSYQTLDNGQSFELCTELSSGKYCWKGGK